MFPLAHILADAGTPIVFITGYGPERIDPRFAGVPVLQKPVQLEALETVLRNRMHNPPIPPPEFTWEEKSHASKLVLDGPRGPC